MTRKVVVFDFAGVVFSWHPPTMLMREVPHLAPDAERAAHWVREIFQAYGGDWFAFDQGRAGQDDIVQRIAQRTGLPASDVLHVVQAVPRELQPIEATLALIRRLKGAGHRVTFLSNMPAPYADHLERSHDFLREFDDGIFSARVQEAKPDAAIFHLAAVRFARKPGDLVFLDDHLPNVEAARSLGWNALHFANAAQAEADMRAQGWI
jgi:putative hydrolase of the HAD superfamily